MSRPDLSGPFAWIERRTTTQLVSALAVLAAVALAGSVAITGQAAEADQRRQAAMAALADAAAIAATLPPEAADEPAPERSDLFSSLYSSVPEPSASI